jgi:hypothetical protein
VITFTKAAARGDVAVAMACVAEDSHDREDIKATMQDDVCSIAWKVTFKNGFIIERMSFETGDTFMLDGNVKKVEGRWLIVGI